MFSLKQFQETRYVEKNPIGTNIWRKLENKKQLMSYEFQRVIAYSLKA